MTPLEFHYNLIFIGFFLYYFLSKGPSMDFIGHSELFGAFEMSIHFLSFLFTVVFEEDD